MVNRSFRQLKGQKLQRKQPKKKSRNKTKLLRRRQVFGTAANPRCRAQRPCRSPRGSGACEAWRWGAAPPRSGWAGWRRRTRRWTTRSSSTRSRWSRRCRSSAWRTGASPPPRWWCKGLRAEKTKAKTDGGWKKPLLSHRRHPGRGFAFALHDCRFPLTV